VKTKIFSILLVLLTLSGCATMMGDRTVNVTGDQIAQKLNEKMALPIQVAKIFNMNLSNSIVNFDKTTGRMTTTMDTKLSSELFDKTLTGKLGISGKMRFDAATQSVVLDEPQIESLDLDGTGGNFSKIFNSLAKTVGGEMLTGLTLYKVKPEDLNFGGTTYAPKDMVVTDTGLQLTLSPAK
jgi:Protein of unknown function (DUF1439)